MRKTLSARLEILASLLVLTGCGTMGIVAFGQQGTGGKPPAGAAGPRSPQRRALLESRIETAREIIRLDLERGMNLAMGANTLLQIVPWSQRLMEDRLELASSRAERLAAIREHRKLVLMLESGLNEYLKGGQCRISDVLKAKYDRLEADQLLVEAGVDLDKEKPAVEPVKNPGIPQPGLATPRPASPR